MTAWLVGCGGNSGPGDEAVGEGDDGLESTTATEAGESDAGTATSEDSGDGSSSEDTTSTDTSTSGDTGTSSDTGTSGDTGTDTGAPDPCEDMELVWIPGEVFTPSPEAPQLTLEGGPYPPLRRIEVDLDVQVGPFRDDPPANPDPNWTPRWDHIIYELFRANQAQSWERMLMGASGRIETNAADRAFNYGRVEIAPGAGSYISWKKAYPWAEGSELHLRQWIDADLDEQTLELHVDDVLDWTITGPVDYYDPSLTTDGLYMHLGTIDADWGLHVSPHGWTFSNLRVCAWQA